MTTPSFFALVGMRVDALLFCACGIPPCAFSFSRHKSRVLADNSSWCTDVSGSMGISTEVEGKIKLRGVKDPMEEFRQFMDPGDLEQFRALNMLCLETHFGGVLYMSLSVCFVCVRVSVSVFLCVFACACVFV